MNAPTDFQPESDIIPGLRREWMVLVRRRWLILAITALSVIGAAAYSFSVRPLFEGIAIVSAGESIPSQPYTKMNGDIPRLKSVVEKEIVRITSRELAMSLFETLTEREKAELASGPLGPWYSRLRFADAAQTDPKTISKAQAVTALRSRLRARWREPSTWIDISVQGYDSQAVAELANHVSALYVTETGLANQTSIDEVRGSLDTQLVAKQKQLGDRLSDLRDLGAESGLGDVTSKRGILERQVRGFQDALVAAQTARVGRAATGRDAARESISQGSASDPRLTAAQNRVIELEDRERTLLATLGPQHPDVVAVVEQLKAARERATASATAVERSASTAYDLALREEARIEANLLRVQKELASLDKGSLSYTLEQKRADASRLAVEQMIQRQETATPIIIQAETIQTASPSPYPSSPRKRENLLYSLVGGLLAGMLLSWVVERFDDSIQSPDDIKGILGLPFLGMVPLVRKASQNFIVAALNDPKSGFADGLRVVRTNLMFGAPQLKPKVLVFTSASPGDGKSTVASAVALLMHETGARVLLIDGDLRRPTIHTIFGLSGESGLSDMLANPDERERDLAVVEGPVPGFDVLPAGPPIVVSAARLGSNQMRSTLTEARTKYDWVIIDSPPSLGLPDAAVLATMADAVVIVCAGDKTPRQGLQSVSAQLHSVGAHVLGVVLNRVDMTRHAYYYGRYYSPAYEVATKSATSRMEAVPRLLEGLPKARVAPSEPDTNARIDDPKTIAMAVAAQVIAPHAPGSKRRSRKSKRGGASKEADAK